MIRYSFFTIILLLLLSACQTGDESGYNFSDQGQAVPEFNADSAYHFVQQQVNFGPRPPGSKAHQQTKKYLLEKLERYAGRQRVFSQEFEVQGYEGDTLEMANVIAAFNTESSDRIMLCAHWDTRPRADRDGARPEEPIVGADDGGSGVAVLLELARLFEKNPPPIGVDIILFDGEDYGREGDLSNYFLGSRYWAANPPVAGYSPRFGILLDMVGGEGARFPMEQYSLRYAPGLVHELWDLAEEMEKSTFLDEEGIAISDDHVIINQLTNIPTLDIIRHNSSGSGDGFPSYWHTHNDNMDIISRVTLHQVGDVLTELIYNRIQSRS